VRRSRRMVAARTGLEWKAWKRKRSWQRWRRRRSSNGEQWKQSPRRHKARAGKSICYRRGSRALQHDDNFLPGSAGARASTYVRSNERSKAEARGRKKRPGRRKAGESRCENCGRIAWSISVSYADFGEWSKSWMPGGARKAPRVEHSGGGWHENQRYPEE
jgi:hypothetical protein